MPNIPPLGATWIVTLECRGHLEGPRMLDGRTHDGTVRLTNTTEFPFTGTRWEMTTLVGNIVMLKSLGHVEGSRYLDGRTVSAAVGLAPRITPPYSGTRWRVTEVGPDEITLSCLGTSAGNAFLDGRTHIGDVQLAPDTAHFSGTRWRVNAQARLVTVQCQGHLDGPRFLDAVTQENRVSLAPTSADPFTGTLWELSLAEPRFLTSRGEMPGNRILDGHTHDGTVGLAPTTARPFTGTRWSIVPLQDGSVALKCLGEAPGSARFLDGRTHDGTVWLAPHTEPPFTGTHWRLASPPIQMGAETADDDDVLAVHAALMPGGSIIYFGGDEYDRNQHDTGNIRHSRLFETSSFLIRKARSPTTDVFCCGHAMLADGRLLVAGGTEKFEVTKQTDSDLLHLHHFPGLHDCWLFDAASERWTKTASLVSEGFTENYHAEGHPNDALGGRWYPTLMTLENGEVLALAGHPCQYDSRHYHHLPERFMPNTPGPVYPLTRSHWTLFRELPGGFEYANSAAPIVYPRALLLPSGKVMSVTPLGGTPRGQLIDPFTQARQFIGDTPPTHLTQLDTFYSQDASAVLLPLLPEENYRARILLCGMPDAYVIDLDDADPRWKKTAPRRLPPAPRRFDSRNPLRYHADAVILPTGDVFVCGGCGVFRTDANAVLEAELYHPARAGTGDSWEGLPAARVVRNYHSVALLLPDGRIWTAGSTHNGVPDHTKMEPRIEILNPPYIERSDRPVIDDVADEVQPGANLVIRSPHAGNIARVAMLRIGSVTHAFNSDQRYVGLSFFAHGPTLLATAPPNHRVAPPGFYLLFIVDAEGRPSEGRFVRMK